MAKRTFTLSVQSAFTILDVINRLLMKGIICTLFFSQLLFSGCSPAIHQLNWLAGTWTMQNPNGSYRLETWDKKGPNAMSGKGLNIMGGDTTLLETIALYADHQHTWYAPTMPDQNNGLVVRFKLMSAINDEYIFENPEHDFPQRIVYKFKPIVRKQSLISTPGDTLSVAVTSLLGEGLHFNFSRK